RQLPAARGAPRASRRRRRPPTANRGPSADRVSHQAFPTDCRTMPLSSVLPFAGATLSSPPSYPAKAGDPVSQSRSFEPRSCGVLETPPSRGMTASYVPRRRTPERYSKRFRARGRIALSGVGLRSQGPGGGSKRTSFRESGRVKRSEGAKVKEKLGRNALRVRCKTLIKRSFSKVEVAGE